MASEDLQGFDTNGANSRKSAGAKVGFMLTEVGLENSQPIEQPAEPTSPSSERASTLPKLVPSPQNSGRGRTETGSSLPGALISVYRVEDAELPAEVSGSSGAMSANLPNNIPMDKVMTNIVQNLDFKARSENSRNMWLKDFKSPPSRAVISDTFWYCICWYFKPGKHVELEDRLYDRIAANFVALFSSVPQTRKDFFFRCYADAVAQAVLYAMFLAYPKSRVHFTEQFRKDLVIRISYWTTGICPEFVDTAHWKLNLGGGDVLQSTSSQTWHHRGAEGAAGAGRVASGGISASQLTLSVDALAGRRTSLAHRPPRPLRPLRYSPLVEHFLKSRKYSSVNLVRATRMSMTMAEERARLMDLKHATLLERAAAARKHCDGIVNDFNEECADDRRQERQRQLQAQTAKKRLEIRRKEVLRSDPHEYANYLVSLHLLQQGLGQGV